MMLGSERPAIIDIVASIAVVGEESSEAEFAGQFPNWITLSSSHAGDPTGAEFRRNSSEVLLPDPPADTVRSLQNHHILHAILRQHFRRTYAWETCRE